MEDSWFSVTAYVKNDHLDIQGFSDGTIKILSLSHPTVKFQKQVHQYCIGSIVVIDNNDHFVRVASADICGQIIIFTISWLADEAETFSADYEFCSDSPICQMANCYPKHPCICYVTKSGFVVSLNWRTGEHRSLKLFSTKVPDNDYGLQFNAKLKLIIISLVTKSGVKLLLIDFVSMALDRLCDTLITHKVQTGSRLSWYCDRFLLCYSDGYVAVLDPYSCCTVGMHKFPESRQIRFLNTSHAEVHIVYKMNSSFDELYLTPRDLLHSKEIEAPPIDITMNTSECILEESEEPALTDESPSILEKITDTIITDGAAKLRGSVSSQASVSKRLSSISDSPSDAEHYAVPIGTADCFPKLPCYIEPNVASVSTLSIGQCASDSNIPTSDFQAGSPLPIKEHEASFSHTSVQDAPSLSESQMSGATDDRLMRLFFPADYGDENSPKPGSFISGVTDEFQDQQITVVSEIVPEANVNEEICADIRDVNFLDLWPIWLDIPLAWNSSFPVSTTATALFNGPLRPTSLSISKHHLYMTDSAQRLLYAGLDCKTVRWEISQDASPADQISSSPNGDILWLLKSGSVFAAQSLSPSSPVGNRWERILLDVSFIHVTDGKAFYIRRDGSLMIQNGLSIRRPSYVSVQLHTPFRLKSVIAAGSEVWGQCADGRVMFNKRLLGNSTGKPHSQPTRRDDNTSDWVVDKYCPPDASRVIAVYAGPFNSVMVCDEQCKLWIRRSATSPSHCLTDDLLPMTKSRHPDDWWLIPLPKQQDGIDDVPANFPKIWPLFAAACNDTIIITSPSLATGNLQLYLSKGQMLGQQLRRIRPTGSALASRWRSVHLVEAHHLRDKDKDEYFECGSPEMRQMLEKARAHGQRRSFAWLIGDTGELLRLDFSTLSAVSPSPVDLRGGNVKLVSVGLHVTWVLLDDGNVWVCHHDAEVDRWAQLDLAQLSDEYLPIIDIAVGPKLVWILTTNALFFRIGISIISASNAASQPALCRLTDDDTSGHDDVALRRIYASPANDWMVFALPAAGGRTPKPILRSSKHGTMGDSYSEAPLARMGISSDVPIGALWHPVLGGPAMADLSLGMAGLFGIPLGRQDQESNSKSSRTSLSPNNSSKTNGSAVYWRAGVRQQDPTGSYWRRVIDGVCQVSAGDCHSQLCMVGCDGSIYVHAVCCFANSFASGETSPQSTKLRSETELSGWEMI